ncbi:MAG: MBL fold metallo-hydrolase [Deltaproteobacteria bacterium]|nr:MBL fold metallo-hydrolase [Deltaproteobacteria bacterium]
MENEMRNNRHDESPWRSLETIFETRSPFLEKTLFMEGFDISSNVYVIAGDYLTIIDPGNDYTVFMALFDRGFKPTDIKKIVFTHGHFEHVMGTFELLGYPSIVKNGEIEIIFHESGPVSFREAADEYRSAVKYTEVGGGETLNLSGFELEVIHTPGHTMDSICLYHAETRSLFTGDTVLPYAVSSPDPAGGGKIEYHLFTLKSLSAMNIDNVLPGHGIPIQSEGKKVIEGALTGVIRRMVGLETSWLEGAAKLAGKGYLEEAVFCCKKELEVDCENVGALELLGASLNDLGRFREAIDVFDKVRKFHKNNIYATIGKGYALMGLTRYEDSLKYFDDALKINPKIKATSIYKGMALYLTGRVDEAMDIEDFQTEFVGKLKDWVDAKGQPANPSDKP